MRPHPHAAERVGFAYGRLGNSGTNSPLVILTGYSPLADERYVIDPHSGARIEAAAIRSAMQEVINRKEGVFHVHMHEWPGRPRFSRMDREELPRLIPSFQVVGPKMAHGLFLLSLDDCVAQVWFPGVAEPVNAKASVVGFPMWLGQGGEGW